MSAPILKRLQDYMFAQDYIIDAKNPLSQYNIARIRSVHLDIVLDSPMQLVMKNHLNDCTYGNLRSCDK
jgi:hypothetical protein